MAAIDKRAHRQAARTNRVDSDDAMAQDGGHDHKRLCQEIGYHEPLGKGAIGRARSQGPSGCRVPNQGPTRIHCLRTTATSSSYAPRGRELADSFFSRVLVHRADVDGPLDQTCSHQGPSYCRNEEEVTTTKKLAGLSKEHEVGHCAEGPLSRVRRSFVTKPPPQSTTMQQPMSMIHSLTGPSPYAQVVPDTDATVVDPLLNISSYPDKVEISILKYRRSEYMDMQKHAHSVGLAGEVSNLQKRISTITECIADYEDRCIKALYHEKSVKDNIYNRGGKRGLSK